MKFFKTLIFVAPMLASISAMPTQGKDPADVMAACGPSGEYVCGGNKMASSIENWSSPIINRDIVRMPQWQLDQNR